MQRQAVPVNLKVHDIHEPPFAMRLIRILFIVRLLRWCIFALLVLGDFSPMRRPGEGRRKFVAGGLVLCNPFASGALSLNNLWFAHFSSHRIAVGFSGITTTIYGQIEPFMRSD